MDNYVVLFIRTSLISFLIGSVLGVEMTIEPAHISYFRNAHVHLNLLGFMAMMIYGVGYHVLPRFSGMMLHSRNLMVSHYYLGVVSLGIMSLCRAGMDMTCYADSLRRALFTSSAAHAASIFLFFYNIYRSIKPVSQPQASEQKA
ncbi:MAG: cbb3-type cytochrome c oxidase subunit I [Candidatus Hydrogenedentota bacterium]|nr:MAG: cbb3-type cytochrome c oxidase subunit I [Candidatus Hydrogenedentota bacterium]